MSEKFKISDLGNRLVFAALEILRDNDGEMLSGALRDEVYNRKNADIPAEAQEKTAKGNVRWIAAFHFQSDNFVKAGFLHKSGGVWHLTVKGAEVLPQGEVEVAKQAKIAYDTWVKQQKSEKIPNDSVEPDVSVAPTPELVLDESESRAKEGIQTYIRSLNWKQFQELSAALLRGMGYHTPEGDASPGRDGGVDIVAYTDPLGGSPRLKVQVKHHAESKTGEPALRELVGVLSDGDIGVFIASGGFAQGCANFARREAKKHLELINLTRFVKLWQEYYGNLSEEDKARLPLQAIYFLDKARMTNE